MSNKRVMLVISLTCLFATRPVLRGQNVDDRLRAVENKINNPNTGLSPRLGTVESKLNDQKTGLSPRVGSIETKIDAPDKGISIRLEKVETTLNDPGDANKEPDKKLGLAPRLDHVEKLISDPNTGLQITSQTLKRLWVLLAAVLVFFMQAGFLCLEVGVGRRRHEGAIGMMNLMNWLVLCVIFYCWGFGLMFGTESLGGFLGVNLFAPSAEGVEAAYKPLGLGLEYLLFQLAFAATAATIVDGAIAERTALFPYFLATVLTGTIVYPIFGHWAWNDLGWLKHIGPSPAYHDAYGDHTGFHDFAGSTVVHSVGAWIAWAGVKFVGPRRYFSRHKAGAFQPYSVGYAVLGVIMLWFGWWGFNGGSLLKYDSTIASIILHTNLAGACAGIVAYLQASFTGSANVYGKTIGGTLGGLVAITACCDVANPMSAMIVGATAGLVHNWAFDRLPEWGIDDVAGAIPVHGACGIWGTMCTGVIIWLVRNGSPWQIAVQGAGVFAAIAWAGGASAGVFWLLEHTVGLRVSISQEDGGQRSPFQGHFDGTLQISFRSWRLWFLRWFEIPMFWSKFGSFREYMDKIRVTHSALPQGRAYVADQVKEERCQFIRGDDTPATDADIEQAVESYYRKAS